MLEHSYTAIGNVKWHIQGSVVKNRPANAEDTGSIPDPGRSHMLGTGTELVLQSLGATTIAAHMPKLPTTMRSPHTPTRESPPLSMWLEHARTATKTKDGTPKGYLHFGKELEITLKIKHAWALRSTQSTPSYLFKKIESACSVKHLHTNVHCSFICYCYKLGRTQTSIIK